MGSGTKKARITSCGNNLGKTLVKTRHLPRTYGEKGRSAWRRTGSGSQNQEKKMEREIALPAYAKAYSLRSKPGEKKEKGGLGKKWLVPAEGRRPMKKVGHDQKHIR